MAPGFDPEIMWTTWIVTGAIGMMLAVVEYRVGYPMPLSPGFMTWLGHFVVFVVGAVLFVLCGEGMYVFRIEDVLWQVGVVNLGLSSFALMYVAIVVVFGAQTSGGGLVWPAIRLSNPHLTRLVILTAVPVVIFFIIRPDYSIGGWGGDLEGASKDVGAVLVFGPLGYVRAFFLVLLGLYVTARGKKNPVVLLGLSIASLGQTFQATLLGGRMAVILALSIPLLTLVAYRWRQRRLRRMVVPMAMGLIAIAIYIPTAGLYRSYTSYGGKQSQLPGVADHVEQLGKSVLEVVEGGVPADEALGLIGSRLYEPTSLLVMKKARDSERWYGARGWGDLALRWLPDFIYEKGMDRESDLLWKEGFRPLRTSFEPITLVGDLYYRFGVGGVIAGYGCLGLMFGLAARICVQKSTAMRFVALMMLSSVLFRMYTADFVHAFWIPLYDWPLAVALAVGLMRLTGRNEGGILSWAEGGVAGGNRHAISEVTRG
jgi:hypothetical protein